MKDDSLAAIQPDAGATPPVVEPVAAPEPPPPPADLDDDGITPEDKAEADEWAAAEEEMFPDLKKVKDGAEDESTKPEKKPEEKPADKDPETPEKPGEDEAESDESADDEEVDGNEPTDAAARLSAREQQAEVDALKSDIREKMFGKVETELRDRDGELLDSIDKITGYINPRTNEPFTEEEAARYLLDANAQLKKNLENIEKTVEQVAEANLDIKDQADVVNFQYGELLRAMPELRAKLWAEYEKTLDKDPKSGIITKAKVSLQNFYEAALEPYAELGRRLETENTTKIEADAKAAEEAKAKEEQTKQQRRQDRSDIYGPGKVDTQTDEDKEWSAAAEAVFGKIT